MCGIVGAVAQRNITPILLEGLKRLEYRGYDSCGIALHADGRLQRSRSTARVAELEKQIAEEGLERLHRHRPHALGHAWRPGLLQCPPALFAQPKKTPAWRWCITASSKTTTNCAPN